MKKKLLILCSSIVTTFSLVSTISCEPISELKDRILFSWEEYLDAIPETIESVKVFEKIKKDIPASKRYAGQKLSKAQLGIDFTDKFPSWATPEVKLSQNWDPNIETDYIYLDVKLTTPDRSSSSTKQVKVTFAPTFDYKADLSKISSTFTSLRSAVRIFQAIRVSNDPFISKDALVDPKDIGYILPPNITKGINIYFKVSAKWSDPETIDPQINLVLDAWLEKEGQINKSTVKKITIEASSFEWENFLDQVSDYYISDMHALEIREKIPRDQRKIGSILSFEKIGVADPFKDNDQDIKSEIKIKEEWNGTSALTLSVILKKDSVADSIEKVITVTPLSNIVPFNFNQDILKYKAFEANAGKTLILRNTKRYLQNSIKQNDLKKGALLTSEQIGMYVPAQTKGLRSTIELQEDWDIQANQEVSAKVKLTLSGEYPQGVNPTTFGPNDISLKFQAQKNVYKPLYELIETSVNNTATINSEGIIEITSDYNLATLKNNIIERYSNADVSLQKLGINNFPKLPDFVLASSSQLGSNGVSIKQCRYKLRMGKDWDGTSDILINVVFSTVRASNKQTKIANSWPYKLIIKPNTT